MRGRELGDALIEIIYQNHEKENKPRQSVRLGYSWVGDECPRAIWYKFRWVVAPEQHDGRLLRLFETGQLEEARFIAELTKTGAEVISFDELNPTKQISVSAVKGHHFGYIDSMGRKLPNAFHEGWAVIEYKTHGSKSFKKLKDSGVVMAKPEHFAQMQGYMRETGVDQALYMAKNKDTDELYCEYVRYSAEFARQLLTKAETVIYSNAPLRKIRNASTSFPCKFCKMKSICHDDETPERNCRTCMSSKPVDNAEWWCEHYERKITTKEQEVGCGNHLFNPHLVPATLDSLDAEKREATYLTLDNKMWTDNGKAKFQENVTEKKPASKSSASEYFPWQSLTKQEERKEEDDKEES